MDKELRLVQLNISNGLYAFICMYSMHIHVSVCRGSNMYVNGPSQKDVYFKWCSFHFSGVCLVCYRKKDMCSLLLDV